MSASNSYTHSEPKTTESTNVSTVNQNVSGNSGLTILGEGNTSTLNYTTSDAGAIEAGKEVGLSGLGLAAHSVDATTGLAAHALDIVEGNARVSSDFAQKVTSNVLSNTKSLVLNNQDFASGLFSQATKALSDVTTQEQRSLGETVSALNEISKQQNTSADQRVADIASNAQAQVASVVKYVILGLALLGGAYALAKSS